jgi:hypothetical protein
VVEVAERYADGLASREELVEAGAAARKAIPWGTPDFQASILARDAAYVSPEDVAYRACMWNAHHLGLTQRSRCELLREIVGNPFRPIMLDPVWRTSTVAALAQAAYDERALPAGTLAPDRLAVLADALEEAGCTTADLLDHLRGPGPHVRGCWVIDLLMGRQ